MVGGGLCLCVKVRHGFSALPGYLPPGGYFSLKVFKTSKLGRYLTRKVVIPKGLWVKVIQTKDLCLGTWLDCVSAKSLLLTSLASWVG